MSNQIFKCILYDLKSAYLIERCECKYSLNVWNTARLSSHVPMKDMHYLCIRSLLCKRDIKN